jgi:hypothetical protein
MTCGPTDGGAPAAHPAAEKAKVAPPADSPKETLDALAVELGRLAAQRDFAKAVEDQANTDLLSPQGRVAS